MYSEYAKDPRMKLNLGIRRRLAPLLDNGRDEIELMHAILFSLPGSPVLYYGDEIAMGDNIYLGDRDGVRTPMQWTGDRNGGFSRADFAQLYLPPLMDPVYGFQAVNIEAQLRTPTSLLRWLRRFIELRKQHPVFGARRLPAPAAREPEDLRPHPLVLGGHRPLRAQPRPVGAGGGARPLAVRRHACRWRCSAARASRGSASCRICSRSARAASSGSSSGPADDALTSRTRIDEGDLHFLDGLVLLGTIASQRWFGAKSRDVLDARVARRRRRSGRVADPRLRDRRGALRPADARSLPAAARIPARRGQLEGVDHRRGGGLDGLRRARRSRARAGDRRPDRRRRDARHRRGDALVPQRRRPARRPRRRSRRSGRWAPSSRTRSLVLDERLVLKVYRRLEAGMNPELELLRFLTERGFEHIAALEGWISYEGRPLEATLAILQQFVPSKRRRVGARAGHARVRPGWLPRTPRRLGEVTAELHNALAVRSRATRTSRPRSRAARRSRSSRPRSTRRSSRSSPLCPDVPAVDADPRAAARRCATGCGSLTHIGQRRQGDPPSRRLPPRPGALDERRGLADPRLRGRAGPLVPERRRKRSPLRDVAGMLRSFAYAASASAILRGVEPPEGWEERVPQRRSSSGYSSTVDAEPPAARARSRSSGC